MKRTIPFLLAVVVIGVIIAYVHKSRDHIETVEVSASLSKGYASIDELVVDSDLIAFAKVGDVVKVRNNGAIPVTDIEFTITTPVLNAKQGQKIILSCGGGIYEIGDKKRRYTIKGDPVPESGEEYLIFVYDNGIGTYTVLGGPQGRFGIKNGKVYSMNILTGDNVGRIHIDGINAKQLQQNVFEKIATLNNN